MNLLIVEDEQLLARQLKQLIALVEPGAQVAAITNSIESTVQWLQTHAAPDLILMDIELADGQCFEIFKQTTITSPVVFTTAYDEYALQAFKVNSIDYLLKPIKEEELKRAFHKWKLLQRTSTDDATQRIQALISNLSKGAAITSNKNRFLVKQGQKLVPVLADDIAYFCAKNTLTFLVTKSKQKFVIDYTLDEVEASIDPAQFFRANRQFILSFDVITAIHTWFNGKLKLDVSLVLEEEIIVSRDKAPLLKEWMGA
jgi:two-component system, LytTR family, response regulator LytT